MLECTEKYLNQCQVFIFILVNQKLTLGKTSKNGPIQSKTNKSKTHEIIDASCVFPPTVCWMRDRDKEADTGKHEKNDPRMFPEPWERENSNENQI